MEQSAIAGNVRRLRADRNWTQGDLAERSSLDRVTVARIECGSIANPRADTLEALADALGVTVDALLREPRKRRAGGSR